MEAINTQHQAALDALNARLRMQTEENARLRNELANQKPVETVSESVKQLVTTPVSVFFDINKDYNCFSEGPRKRTGIGEVC